jgi:hypothetical protein
MSNWDMASSSGISGTRRLANYKRLPQCLGKSERDPIGTHSRFYNDPVTNLVMHRGTIHSAEARMIVALSYLAHEHSTYLIFWNIWDQKTGKLQETSAVFGEV